MELLSFLLTANTNSLWILSDKAVYFLSKKKKTGNTLCQLSHKWGVKIFNFPPPDPPSFAHRNIWLLLHISFRLRRQPSDAQPCKLHPGLYTCLSFKSPRQSRLQTISRERKRNFVRASSWRCKQRPLFEVRCGCASLIHLCTETRQESLIFHDNTSRLLRKAHSYSWIKELYWLNYEHAATSRKMKWLKLSSSLYIYKKQKTPAMSKICCFHFSSSTIHKV